MPQPFFEKMPINSTKSTTKKKKKIQQQQNSNKNPTGNKQFHINRQCHRENKIYSNITTKRLMLVKVFLYNTKWMNDEWDHGKV